MFEWFFWPSAVNAVSNLPKETVYVGVAAYVVLEINRRHANVKIAEANARVAEANLEMERLKAQQNAANLRSV